MDIEEVRIHYNRVTQKRMRKRKKTTQFVRLTLFWQWAPPSRESTQISKSISMMRRPVRCMFTMK